MSNKILKNSLRVLAIATAISGVSFNASAADMDVPAANWTGFYIGGYLGAGAIVNEISVAAGGGSFNFNGIGGEGILGGGMAGFNFQISPQFVIGLQGEVGLTDLETSFTIPGIVNLSAAPEFTAGVSARAGYLTSPDTLLYIIGGYSYADYDVDITAGPGSLSVSQDYHGFHIGTGIETRITPSLTARLEYRYTQYGGDNWGLGGGVGAVPVSVDIEPSSHTGTIGIAWHLFQPGGEVVTPAADLDPAPEADNWTGFYVGAQLGGGALVHDITLPAIGGLNFNGIGGEGVIGGGFAGYNFRVSPKFVVGLQADVGYSDLETSVSLNPGIFSLSAKPGFVFNVSGRAGMLASEETLLYLIGGYSHTKYKATISIPVIPATASFSQKYHGFHIGSGIETRLNEQLTARVEYRYTQYGSESWGTGGFLNVEPSTHTGMIGLAWNFGNLM